MEVLVASKGRFTASKGGLCSNNAGLWKDSEKLQNCKLHLCFWCVWIEEIEELLYKLLYIN